jgi:hypothetical protein
MTVPHEIVVLASLRKRKGIPIRAIAHSTRISVRYLEAIEDGRIDQLPDGIYRTSYLRQYAEMIDEEIAESLVRTLAESTKPVAVLADSRIKETWIWRRWLAKGLAAVAGVLLPIDLPAEQPVAVLAGCPPDPRCHVLSRFFQQRDSPLVDDASHFLKASDKHRLDWRLLPSLAMIESSGGKYYQNKNVFGWQSGRARFQSIREGIEFVASRLAESPIYAGKDVATKLRIYNPARHDYGQKVMGVMRELGPDVQASARPRIQAKSR